MQNNKKTNNSISFYLYIVTILWFLLMIALGLTWVFKSDNNISSDLKNRIFNDYKSFPKIDVNSLRGAENNFRKDRLFFKLGESLSERHSYSPISTVVKELPKVVSIESTKPSIAIVDIPQVLKTAPPIPIKHVTKDELRGKIWSMKAVDQRAALQGLHDTIPPSDKAANVFIEYAKQSILEGVKPGDPAIPFPGTGIGQPGEIVSYTIAGKTVRVPYGYPEDTIFILTASYKDPEAASTIARAFARAAHPERISFGIHAQNEGGDAEPERDPIGGLSHIGVKCPQHPVCSFVDKVRVSRQHYTLSEGPTVARARAELLYRNETYVLGIDSHCHFVRGWDNVAIDMFKRTKNDYAIISTYPDSYPENQQGGDGTEEYEPPPMPSRVTAICQTRRVNLHTTVSFKHNFNSIAAPKNGPIRVAFFAAGFSFSRGHRISRVPYDFYTPYIFDGEETSMGMRAWTWGYDLYQPDRTVIGHLYISSGSSLRPVFWDSPDWGIQWPLQYHSLLRLQKELHIFDVLQKHIPGGADPGGIQRVEKLDMSDFKKYEVGPRRNASEFWKWAKIDLQNNWGENCNEPHYNPMSSVPMKKGRQYCYSEDLCGIYQQGEGMPFIPWNAGTENI